MNQSIEGFDMKHTTSSPASLNAHATDPSLTVARSGPTPLRQLDALVQEIQQPRLRQMLSAVLSEPSLKGEILAAHFASQHNPVLVEPTGTHEGNPRLPLAIKADLAADPNEAVACPNIAQLQMVARMARDTGLTYPFEREMLYVAAVLQGLVVIGVRHQGLSLDQARDEMRARVRKPLGALEDDSPVMGWHLRLALGLGTEEDQSAKEGQRYVGLVAHAWQRADRTLAWRRHVVKPVATGVPVPVGPTQPTESTTQAERGSEQIVRPGSFATLSSGERMRLARHLAGWGLEDASAIDQCRVRGAQVKAEALAYLQANAVVRRQAGKAA
jgi:hypothetical protein